MNEITPAQEAQNEVRDEQFKSNPLLQNEWEIATLWDGCELYCVLTPSTLMIRLYNDDLGSIHYEHVNELFDASRMCERLEVETGPCLEPAQWCSLLESAVIHYLPDVPHVNGD